MTVQRWDSSLYEDRHSFVWKYGEGLLPLLEAKPGERIIDLGCGTGHLTARIAECGAHVTGVDGSPDMIAQARQNFPNLRFQLADAREFSVDQPADAVFSNAVLHWVQPAEKAAARIAAALAPGGRFVAEFGGKGNVRHVLDALLPAVAATGVTASSPWYFPSVGEYSAILESVGLEVRFATLFDRPTPTDDPRTGFRDWCEMFCKPMLAGLTEAQRRAVLVEAEERARPFLHSDSGWQIDYRRLRVVAFKI